MISGDNYEWEQDAQPRASSPFRWIVFIAELIIGIMLILIYLAYMPAGFTLLAAFFLFPMLFFMLWATFRWAQGRPLSSPTTGDEEILEPMRHHALPAQQVGLGMFRCPDCGMSFETTNAQPVEENIVLCPICGVRLYIK